MRIRINIIRIRQHLFVSISKTPFFMLLFYMSQKFYRPKKCYEPQRCYLNTGIWRRKTFSLQNIFNILIILFVGSGSSPFLDTDPDPALIFDTNTVTDQDIFYGSAPLGKHSELDREEKMCHLCRDVWNWWRQLREISWVAVGQPADRPPAGSDPWTQQPASPVAHG